MKRDLVCIIVNVPVPVRDLVCIIVNISVMEKFPLLLPLLPRSPNPSLIASGTKFSSEAQITAPRPKFQL